MLKRTSVNSNGRFCVRCQLVSAFVGFVDRAVCLKLVVCRRGGIPLRGCVAYFKKHRTAMRGANGCFSAQRCCNISAMSRPHLRQARCCKGCPKPAVFSLPSFLPVSNVSADMRCFTAALDREVIPAKAPEEEFVNRETLPAPAPGVLQHNATIFVEEHRIRAYEVGADQKTTISTIANLLQVSAGYPLLSVVLQQCNKS